MPKTLLRLAQPPGAHSAMATPGLLAVGGKNAHNAAKSMSNRREGGMAQPKKRKKSAGGKEEKWASKKACEEMKRRRHSFTTCVLSAASARRGRRRLSVRRRAAAPLSLRTRVSLVPLRSRKLTWYVGVKIARHRCAAHSWRTSAAFRVWLHGACRAALNIQAQGVHGRHDAGWNDGTGCLYPSPPSWDIALRNQAGIMAGAMWRKKRRSARRPARAAAAGGGGSRAAGRLWRRIYRRMARGAKGLLLQRGDEGMRLIIENMSRSGGEESIMKSIGALTQRAVRRRVIAQRGTRRCGEEGVWRKAAKENNRATLFEAARVGAAIRRTGVRRGGHSGGYQGGDGRAARRRRRQLFERQPVSRA